jgi:hypothetical protein
MVAGDAVDRCADISERRQLTFERDAVPVAAVDAGPRTEAFVGEQPGPVRRWQLHACVPSVTEERRVDVPDETSGGARTASAAHAQHREVAHDERPTTCDVLERIPDRSRPAAPAQRTVSTATNPHGSVPISHLPSNPTPPQGP